MGTLDDHDDTESHDFMVVRSKNTSRECDAYRDLEIKDAAMPTCIS